MNGTRLWFDVDGLTLVCVGDRDSVTPVDASREIRDALPAGMGRFEMIAGAGHFRWLDDPVAYWAVIGEFLATVTTVR